MDSRPIAAPRIWISWATGDPEQLESTFKALCTLQTDPDDGMRFDAASVRAETIRDEEEYEGRRILFTANLSNIPASIQVDVGFGYAGFVGRQQLRERR